jgi:hypothetical protein
VFLWKGKRQSVEAGAEAFGSVLERNDFKHSEHPVVSLVVGDDLLFHLRDRRNLRIDELPLSG